MYDAIMVGAGPAGSASAALLAQGGARVSLLDRAAFPRDKACGEYTSPQTEHVLKRLGVLDKVIKAGGQAAWIYACYQPEWAHGGVGLPFGR